MDNRYAIVDGVRWSWGKLRSFVYERDNYICDVCKKVADVPHCGHIVDHMNDPDNPDINHPDNLVVMCEKCNMRKPIHETREEYISWKRGGHWKVERLQDIIEIIKKYTGLSEDELFDRYKKDKLANCLWLTISSLVDMT